MLRSGAKFMTDDDLRRMVDDAVRIPAAAIQGGFDTWAKASFAADLVIAAFAALRA